MKAFGPKRQPFIQIINIFAGYTEENNRMNACLEYKIENRRIRLFVWYSRRKPSQGIPTDNEQDFTVLDA